MRNIFHKIRDDKKARETGKAGLALKECQKKLGPLCDVAQKVSAASEVSKLLEEILSMIQQMTQASASSLLLIDEGKGELYFKTAGGAGGNRPSKTSLSLDSGTAGWVARNGKPLAINEVARDKRFNEEIDRVTGFTTKSVLAVPLLRGQKVIGILEAINKADGCEFDEQDLAALRGFAATETLILLVSMAATAANNIEQHQILIDWYKNIFETLISAADAKDPYAYGHSKRVKRYTMMAANTLPLPTEELQAIELGALLHDIGKIDILDTVLRKSGPLTDAEWHTMRKHALRGANILSGIPFLETVRDIVLYHHERYDGKGYPHGLKGKNIPIGARLVAVAEAFDTMTTTHAYRVKMSADDALEELTKGIRIQFCPVAVEAFVSAFEKSREEPLKVEDSDPAQENTERGIEVLAKAGDAAEAGQAASLEADEGEVQMAITSPDGFEQVKQFKKQLETIDNLKIISDGWSEAKGNVIFVSVQKPMALTSLLTQMPMVEKVDKSSKKLSVRLKTPAASKAFKHGFSLIWPR